MRSYIFPADLELIQWREMAFVLVDVHETAIDNDVLCKLYASTEEKFFRRFCWLIVSPFPLNIGIAGKMDGIARIP